MFDAAQTLNAEELYIGGLPSNITLPNDLPAPTNALVGCFESPYFNSYSILEESPERLDFSDSTITWTRFVYGQMILTLRLREAFHIPLYKAYESQCTQQGCQRPKG